MLSYVIDLSTWWLLILCAVFTLINTHKLRKSVQTKVCVALSFVTAILMAFRSLGMDIVQYRELYPKVFSAYWQGRSIADGIQDIFSQPYEPLNYIIALLAGPNGFHIYLFISVLFPLMAVLYIAKKRDNPCLYYLPYYLMYFFFIDGTRQYFASGFYILSFTVKSFSLALVYASGMWLAHYGTAICSLAVVVRKKLSQVSILFIGLICILIAALVTRTSLLQDLFGSSVYFQSRFSTINTGFGNSINLMRTFEVLCFPILTFLYIFFNPNIRSCFKLNGDSTSASQKDRWSTETCSRACRSVEIAFFSVVVLMLGTLNEVLAYRMFYMLATPFFIVVGYYLEHDSSKYATVMTVLYLLILCVSHTIYYLYVFL